MAYFGVPQRTGLAFGLNARQFAKAFSTLFVGLIFLFVFHQSFVGLFGFIVILAVGMLGFFLPVQELPLFNWLETITTHAAKTARWKPQVLQHSERNGGIKADYSPFLVELRRSGSVDYVSHAWGNALLWKLDIPAMNGFAYLPSAEQNRMLASVEKMMQDFGRNPGVVRFGFTTLDMPSTADGVQHHLDSLPVSPPRFYEEVAQQTAAIMRDTHIWFFVTTDGTADMLTTKHNVELALQMAAVTATPLTMTDIGWHVIGILSDPFTWADKHLNQTFAAPFPEVIKAQLDYVQTDTVKHQCRMVTTLPRQEVQSNWWAQVQPRIPQPDVALATTVTFNLIPNDQALKMAGRSLQAAEGAIYESQVTKGKTDFTAARQLSDAARRNQEIVSGAALYRVIVGYHVMSKQLASVRNATRIVDGTFRTSGLDVQTCNGRQLEAFRMLMPFGITRNQAR